MRVHPGTEVVFEDYFSVCGDSFCSVTLAAQRGPGFEVLAAPETVTGSQEEMVVYAYGSTTLLLEMAKADTDLLEDLQSVFDERVDSETTNLEYSSSDSLDNATQSKPVQILGMPWYAALGSFVAAGAIIERVFKGDDSASLDDNIGANDQTNITISGNVSVGPMITDNGLVVSAYMSDGTLLGSSLVSGDTGSYEIAIQSSYSGEILVRAVDSTAGPDYFDENSAAITDLTVDLRGAGSIDGTGSYTVNLNPFTEAAVRLLELDGGDEGESTIVLGNLDALMISGASDQVAEEVGLTAIDLFSAEVITTVDMAGIQNADVNAYGSALSTFLEAGYTNGLMTSDVIDELVDTLAVIAG